jgi:hypothetical protein
MLPGSVTQQDGHLTSEPGITVVFVQSDSNELATWLEERS